MGIKTKTSGGLAAMMLILAPFTMQHEGIKIKDQLAISYRDTGKVWTYCYGETVAPDGTPVARDLTATVPQCKEMLTVKLGFFAMLIKAKAPDTMPDEVWAAATDLAYNVGWGAFKKSTLFADIKAGNYGLACNQFMRWKYVAGRDCNLKASNCPGIMGRRVDETALCKKGIQ